MPDLTFQVESAEPERGAAVPQLLFHLRLEEMLRAGQPATLIHTIALRCQIRIEPARRRYSTREQERLLALFGTPERWGQTLRPMPWIHVSTTTPSFTGTTVVKLPVPCSQDFTLAATRYFDALEEGDLPLCFLFSGTLFIAASDGRLQVAQLPWDREATFRLPVATWRELMDIYYPSNTFICLRKDVFHQLDEQRLRTGAASWEQALEALLAQAAGLTSRE